MGIDHPAYAPSPDTEQNEAGDQKQSTEPEKHGGSIAGPRSCRPDVLEKDTEARADYRPHEDRARMAETWVSVHAGHLTRWWPGG